VNRAEALERALAIAAEASAIVLEVYGESYDVEYKGKNDPVTRADREANDHITRALAAAFPGVAIVAEESPPETFLHFETAERVWFVDPLDGTREFVARNGEFAVMIGLAERGRPTLGVVAIPVSGRTFGAAEGVGAFELVDGARVPIAASKETDLAKARVVVSRSHRGPEADEAIRRLGAAEVKKVGSAGIKAALVACGEAEIYVHPGRAGKRWDACAPEAIVRCAGGRFTTAKGALLDYTATDLSNADGVLVTNGRLYDAALRALTPSAARPGP
jgi:3'(2'), 5'-bisphosphate nucleotidase